MKYKKKNGLYIPQHYMGCMGIEDTFPPPRSNVSAIRKGVMSPAGGGGTTGGGTGEAAPPAGYLDPFTDTDGVHLADHTAVVTWTTTDDSTTIQSNMASTATYKANYCYTATSISNLSQIIVQSNTATSGGNSIGVCVRASGADATTFGYWFKLYNTDGTNWTQVAWYKNNSYVNNTSLETFAQNTTHTLKIEAVTDGDSHVDIYMYIDGGAVGSAWHDSASPIASGSPGFVVQSDSVAIRADNWQDY